MYRLTRLFGLVVLSLTGVLFITGSGPANSAPTSTMYASGDFLGCC
jgi:hypothetical protein